MLAILSAPDYAALGLLAACVIAGAVGYHIIDILLSSTVDAFKRELSLKTPVNFLRHALTKISAKWNRFKLDFL
jgi:hypothetical protein